MNVTDQTHNASLPKFYDLRQEQSGCFTPVENQGECPSCWAFAVASTIADQYAIQNAKAKGKGYCDKQVNMSEEDLLWCSGAAAGPSPCASGGYLSKAFEYLGSKGVSTARCNPYGHGSGYDSLGYGGCPTQCKGTGNINNKVTAVGVSGGSCQDTDYGKKDAQGDNCAVYNANTHWCGLQDTAEFKSNQMCCGCKGAQYVRPDTTADIQSFLHQNGPMSVGMPVQKHMYNIGSAVYRPSNTGNDGGHAIECLGWGHDEYGEGQWIMKNSWGCNFGDAGYFKQSWAFNSESSFFGIPIDGSSSFTNDVPHDEEPECKVPEDSNNSDHCAQYNEFGTCSYCNSGYELTNDAKCKLKDEDDIVDPDPVDPIIDDGEHTEDIFWQQCQTGAGIKGYLCPADNTSDCQYISDGTELECSTWLDVAAANNLASNCSLCTPEPIEFCATQSGALCLECSSGYSANASMDVCLKDSCDTAAGEESTPSGDCVVPKANCVPGNSTLGKNGKVQCSMCKPGFKIDTGNCQALPDPENCAEVEMTNPERTCKVCEKGQYTGPDGFCLEEDGTCSDSDPKGATDILGGTCQDYTLYPIRCDQDFDGNDFKAKEMCCMCKPKECQDSDNGAVDPWGDGCATQTKNPDWCGGKQDDEDFKADEMCCVCKSSKKTSLKWNKAKQLTKSSRKTKDSKKLNKSTRKSQMNQNAQKRLSIKKSRVNRKKLSKK